MASSQLCKHLLHVEKEKRARDEFLTQSIRSSWYWWPSSQGTARKQGMIAKNKYTRNNNHHKPHAMDDLSNLDPWKVLTLPHHGMTPLPDHVGHIPLSEYQYVKRRWKEYFGCDLSDHASLPVRRLLCPTFCLQRNGDKDRRGAMMSMETCQKVVLHFRTTRWQADSILVCSTHRQMRDIGHQLNHTRVHNQNKDKKDRKKKYINPRPGLN